MIEHLARPPREHQLEGLRRSAHRETYGLFYDPRCGKSKVTIDTTVLNYRKPPYNIDALLIIAWPSGVHRVWVEDELPLDIPPDIPTQSVVWRSGKMANRDNDYALAELLKAPGLAVLSINCEALLTDAGWKYIAKFLSARRCLVAADESSWAASPSAARSKRLLAIGRHPHAVMRRILDGTPVDESPLNLFVPCSFLSPSLLGHKSFFTFKLRYAKLEEGYAPGGRTFQKIVGYQNLEELQTKLDSFTHRVRRSDITDAPAKVYQKHLFQLSSLQRKVYNTLRDEYVAELSDRSVQVTHVLDRLTKLSMVARGYYPPRRVGIVCSQCEGTGCERCDDFGLIIETLGLARIDPDHNPALDALRDELRLATGPIIIWNRFIQDVDDTYQALLAAGRTVGRYDGTIAPATRENDYLAFRAGKLDAITATVTSGLSRGHDLSRAETALYYSDGYSLRGRRQTEDRTEVGAVAVKRSFGTSIVDLIAEDTVDEARVAAQREKLSLAEMLLRDPPTKWL